MKYVTDKSTVADDFLYKDRLYQLSKDNSGKYRTKDALSTKTKGYQYYCSMRVGQDKVGPIRKPETKYTVHRDFLIGDGTVDSLWVVTSSTDKSGTLLRERCKKRMDNRACPQLSSFDEYVRVRTSCYFIEEKDGVFYCDCWEGMKGKQDKHSIAMMYYTGKWEAEADVRAVPLGKTRKPGRPKKIPHCLTRSPARPSSPPVVDQEADLADSPSPPPPLPPVTSSLPPVAFSPPPPLRRTTRKRPLAQEEDAIPLGNSKPPKKKARQAQSTWGSARGRGKGKGRGRGKGI